MAALTTIIAAASLAVAAGGTALAYQGQQKQEKANKQALAQQQELEAQRQKQMELDAERRRNQMIRQAVAARAASTSLIGNAGALGPGSSAMGGAMGGISGQSGVNQLGVNQNEEIGQTMFGLNAGILGSYRSAASGAGMASLGNGLASLGGAVLRNSEIIGKVGTYFGSSLFPSSGSSGGGIGSDYVASR